MKTIINKFVKSCACDNRLNIAYAVKQIILSLEDTNADLIRREVPKIERLKILREKAYRQLELLKKNQDTIEALKKNLIEDTETNS